MTNSHSYCKTNNKWDGKACNEDDVKFFFRDEWITHSLDTLSLLLEFNLVFYFSTIYFSVVHLVLNSSLYLEKKKRPP